MMTSQDMLAAITLQLKQIIANELDVNVHIEDIADNESLFEDGVGLDSIAIVELISLIEERMGCSFEDEALTMDSFKDIHTLSHCIAARMVQQEEGS